MPGYAMKVGIREMVACLFVCLFVCMYVSTRVVDESSDHHGGSIIDASINEIAGPVGGHIRMHPVYMYI
jgi:hypothetical protein